MSTPQASLKLPLAHSQPVPRHLVHRTAIAEVFPTGSTTDGDDILVACQLPVGHRLYNDRNVVLVDPLLILEAARQAALLCCLRHLGAAPDATFVVRSAQLRVLRPLPQPPGTPPWDVQFRCTPGNLRFTDDTLTGGQLVLTLHADGSEVASISFDFAALAPGPYRSLREPGMGSARDHTPATPPRYQPLEPGSLGRKCVDNVVLAVPGADAPRDWPVIVRADHSGFFDHPLDHVSAAIMVEACRQAAQATCPSLAVAGDLVSMQAEFTTFAELGPPLYARVADAPAPPNDQKEANLTVTLIQLGAAIATVDVTLRSTSEFA